MSKKKIFFYNTFNPVVPFFEKVLPLLNTDEVQAKAVTSQAVYREGELRDAGSYCQLYIPKFMRKNKRIAGICYFLLAPVIVLLKKSDCNIFLTQPPLFFILGGFLSRLKRTPYVVHVMDMYPDLLLDTKGVNRRGLGYRLLDFFAKKSYQNAKHVFVIGECMKKRLEEKGVNSEKITLVTNWADEGLVPVAKEENLFRKQYALEDDFLIMYSGNMGYAHILDTILAVAKGLESESKIKFVFIGRGRKKYQVELAIKNGAENILLFDYQPIELLAHSLSAGDVHFLSLAESFTGKIVPSKFYGILACGRPAIYEGSPDSEVAVTIREYDCGSVVPIASDDSLRQAVLLYYQDHLKWEHAAKASEDAYNSKFSQSISTARYKDTILALLNLEENKC